MPPAASDAAEPPTLQESLPFPGLSFRRVLAHPVVHNALGLYGIQFAGYLLPLVTIPYLARVLRPQGLGLVVFAQSFALWGSLILEYGFNLSAAREVARSQGNPERIAQIVASVIGAKGVLTPGTVCIGLAAGFSLSIFQQHREYLAWAMLYILALGFSPFWYFQGTERMTRAVLVELFARTLATVGVFLWVKASDDGWKVLALQASSGWLITGITLAWVYREVPCQRPKWDATVLALKQGWNMFVFRGVANLFATANAFILGIFAAPTLVGYYGGAEKIAKAGLGLFGPISLALYPRMSHLMARDPRRATRLARMCLIIMGTLGVGLWGGISLAAPLLVRLILGEGYQEAVMVLQVLALLMPINALTNVLSVQWMLPLGMDRTVSFAVLLATALDIILAIILAPKFAHMGMAWVAVVANLSMLLVLSLSLWWHTRIRPAGCVTQ